MGGVTIYILPMSAADAMDSRMSTITLPHPLTTATSDADGKFEFSLPKNLPFYILAQGRRLAGMTEEIYEWRDTSANMKQLPTVLLNNDNHQSTQRAYRFD